jgi:hypothetical protein
LGDYLAAARSAAAGRRSRPGSLAVFGASMWQRLDVATAEAKPPPSFLLPRGVAMADQPGRSAWPRRSLGQAGRRPADLLPGGQDQAHARR